MLDTFVSCDKSIIHQLSDASWQRGPVTVHAESVPFSYSTGRHYAQLVSACLAQIQAVSQQTVKVLEVGAGNGLCAAHCATNLAELKIPFQYTVTDYSPAVVAALKEQPQLHSQSQITVQAFDILEQQVPQEVDVVVLNYVLDTCPVRRLQWHHHTLYEWEVAVTVKPAATMKRYDQGRFIQWDAPAIKALLTTQPPSDWVPVLSQLHTCLEWSWRRVPCSPAAIDPSGVLAAYVASCPQDVTGFFNISTRWWTILDRMFANPHQPRWVWCYDFSSQDIASCPQNEHAYSQFGPCCFYTVPFFLLRQYCQEKGVYFLQSRYTYSENQVAIMTSVSDASLRQTLQQLLDGHDNGERTDSLSNQLIHAKTEAALNQTLHQLQHTLTQAEQSDYVLRFNQAERLAAFKRYEESVQILDAIVSDYGPTALNAVILKAKIQRKNKQISAALATLEASHLAGKNYDLFHLEYVFCYAACEQWAACRQAVASYFSTLTYNPQWHLESLLSLS